MRWQDGIAEAQSKKVVLARGALDARPAGIAPGPPDKWLEVGDDPGEP